GSGSASNSIPTRKPPTCKMPSTHSLARFQGVVVEKLPPRLQPGGAKRCTTCPPVGYSLSVRQVSNTAVYAARGVAPEPSALSTFLLVESISRACQTPPASWTVRCSVSGCAPPPLDMTSAAVTGPL